MYDERVVRVVCQAFSCSDISGFDDFCDTLYGCGMMRFCKKKIDLIALQMLRVLSYEGGLTGFQVSKAIKERRGDRIYPSSTRVYEAFRKLRERGYIKHGVPTTTEEGEPRKTWVRVR